MSHDPIPCKGDWPWKVALNVLGEHSLSTSPDHTGPWQEASTLPLVVFNHRIITSKNRTFLVARMALGEGALNLPTQQTLVYPLCTLPVPPGDRELLEALGMLQAGGGVIPFSLWKYECCTAEEGAGEKWIRQRVCRCVSRWAADTGSEAHRARPMRDSEGLNHATEELHTVSQFSPPQNSASVSQPDLISPL